MNEFKAFGCSLVFFSDLNIQEDKIDVWLNRRTNEFELLKKVYDAIYSGKSLSDIHSSIGGFLDSAFMGMAAVAQSYGEFNYSTNSDCDLEIAKCAKSHNAIAIITNDTDFLIFNGPWRYWAAQTFLISSNDKKPKIFEYKMDGLETLYSFSKHHLPLFATLLGNDYTSSYGDQLYKFQCNLKPDNGNRFQKFANFVRKIGNEPLSDLDIRRLTQHIFGNADAKIQKTIKNSLDSYDIDKPTPTIHDSFIEKLKNISVYQSYMENMGPIHGMMLDIYDMGEYKQASTFPSLLLKWIRRKRGILQQKTNEVPFEFTVLVQFKPNEKFEARTETPKFVYFDASSCTSIGANIFWK